jgi:chromosome segregation ATPase
MGRPNPYRHPLGRRCGDPKILPLAILLTLFYALPRPASLRHRLPEGEPVSDVPKAMSDPAVVEWRAALGQSTSAQLRETERERDEALRRAADLEQVRQELAQTKSTLDTFVEDNQRLESDRADLVDASLALKRTLAASQQDLTAMQEQRDEARAELEIAERERDGARAAAEEFWRQRDKARAERDALAKELSAARHQNRILAAENESALRRLNEVTP